MIRCDVEGVTGVVANEQTQPDHGEYKFGCAMFHSDLLALLEGLIQGGADELVIYDEHYHGRNIDLERLPKQASAICGKPPYRADWAGGLDHSFAGVILLGLHSRSGTDGALLPHSYEPDIRNLILNGVTVGEIGIEAAVAGDYNVPVVMSTGDSAAMAEAQELLNGVRIVVVKESFSETGALCYPAVETAERISKAAQEVVKNPPPVSPYSVGKDVTLEVQLNDGAYLDTVRHEFKDSMTNDHALLLRSDSATAAWAQYWQIRLHCQKLIAEAAK